MRGLVAFNLWRWIDDARATFEPPVGRGGKHAGA